MNLKKLNLVPAIGMALALSLSFTSCIDNSESDGVSAMRQAQAELIKARAANETTEAAAQAALLNAQAAYQNALASVESANVAIVEAEAAMKILLNKEQEIKNELLTAETTFKKDSLTALLEVVKAQYVAQKAQQDLVLATALSNIEEQKIEAEAALALANYNLEKNLVTYSTLTGENANKYYGLYSTTLGLVQGLRSQITTLQFDIEKNKVTLVNYTTEQAAETTKVTIADKKESILKDEKSIADYEAANTFMNDAILNPSGLENAKVAANTAYETLAADSAAKSADKEQAKATMDLAEEVKTNTGTVYSDLLTSMTDLPSDIEGFKNDVRSASASINTANESIALNNSSIADNQAIIAAYTAKLTQYQTDKNNKLTAYNSALTIYNTALKTLEKAQAKYDIDPTPTNGTAVSSATIAYNTAESNKNDAKSELDTATANVKNTSDDITALEDAIESSEEAIQTSENTIVEQKLKKAKAESDLAAAEAEYTDVLSKIDAAKTTYEAAVSDHKSKSDMFNTLSDELDVINADRKIQFDLMDALKGSIEDMEKLIEDNLEAIKTLNASILTTQHEIETLENVIADGVVTKAEFEQQIADKEAKLAELNTELVSKQTLAADYKAMLDAELAK